MSAVKKEKVYLCWFRRDLRLGDNPALARAADTGEKILPVYIDDDALEARPLGSAARRRLVASLHSLNKDLDGKLCVYKGDAEEIFDDLFSRFEVNGVFYNALYEKRPRERDASLTEKWRDSGIESESFNGSLLWEPWKIQKQAGGDYSVFTPYYKNASQKTPPEPTKAPSFRAIYDDNSAKIDSFAPKEETPENFDDQWTCGEKAAQDVFYDFMDESLGEYDEARDRPDKRGTSRLSSYLRFGEISPRQLWHAARACGDSKHIDRFCSELGWRDFCYHILYFSPDIARNDFRDNLKSFPWRTSKKDLEAWRSGKTGVPMVDAGMRELLRTGVMHNRVRMIVASFLVKNLMIHWHEGERWFWERLIDADPANNPANWQWVAGCGADAAPYFRIFNPVTQGQKFDKSGEYVRKYVPELRKLPKKYLHAPWNAPQDELESAGVTLGQDYPHPIVDIKESRRRALEAYKAL